MPARRRGRQRTTADPQHTDGLNTPKFQPHHRLINCTLGGYVFESFALNKGNIEIVLNGSPLSVPFATFQIEDRFRQLAFDYASAPLKRLSQREWEEAALALLLRWGRP